MHSRPAVFFLPETGFYPFTRGLAILGDALRTKGRDVLFTRCSGQMPRCSMLVGHQVSLPESDSIRPRHCASCKKIFSDAQKYYGFGAIDLDALITDDLRSHLKKIEGMDTQDLLDLSFLGFPLGRIAQYDFCLESKRLISQDMDASHVKLFRAHVANTYVAAFFAQKITETLTPNSFCTFNQYAQCQLVRHISQSNNILYQSLCYPVNFGVDASLFELTHQEYSYTGFKHCQQWNSVRETPIPAEKAFECWKDVVFRCNASGSHIYSPSRGSGPDAIFTKLGLNPNRKVIVAYTSSHDEIFGINIAMDIWKEKLPEKFAFSNQIEWLKDLRDWAASREDVQVVVRIHPREGKNKNYKFSSEHLEELQDAFKKNTDKFIVVWPEEDISSYDLLELAHACIVPWTTVGFEAARVGVPTLSWAGNMYYSDDDFIQVATEYEEYRQRLDAFTTNTSSLATLTRAIRYYHWRTFAPSLDMQKTVPSQFDNPAVWPPAPPDMKADIAEIFENRRTPVNYNLKKWQESLPPDAANKETMANLKGLRLFLATLFFPPAIDSDRPSLLFRAFRKLCRIALKRTPAFLIISKDPKHIPFTDYRLEFHEDFSALHVCKERTAKDPGLCALVAEDDWHVWYVRDGKGIRRMSPLVLRLGRIFTLADNAGVS